MATRWLTPQAATGDNACRRLSIPVELIHVVTGALDQLTNAEAWEAFGDMTPDEAASLCAAMIDDYLQSDGACMIGTIVAGAWENMPANIIECDGATRLRVDFPLLWDVLDQEYIIDADSFRTPDLRGRMIIGVGTGAGLTTRLLADTGGAETVTLSVDQLPAHTHSVNESGLNVDVEPPAGVPDAAGGLPLPSTTGSTGGGDPVSIMPPFYALRYGMVAK